jgi:hypothetical protein
MNDDLTMRVDAITGGLLAQTSMLLALISTHPNPKELQHAFRQIAERGYAALLNTPYGEGTPEGFHALVSQLEQQLQTRPGTLPTAPS